MKRFTNLTVLLMVLGAFLFGYAVGTAVYKVSQPKGTWVRAHKGVDDELVWESCTEKSIEACEGKWTHINPPMR